MDHPKIAVLGGGGLIGEAVARHLQRQGFAVHVFARRLTASQRFAFGRNVTPASMVSCSQAALDEALRGFDIVINCIGVLQDSPGSDTDDVHRAFMAKMANVCAGVPQKLLIHFSIPGIPEDDHTPFSRTKRLAESLLAQSGASFAILRPGFVIAPAAYGGSALIRALAMLPIRLAPREALAPFAAVAMTDICETVAQIAARWRKDERVWRESWDLMEESPATVGQIVEIFRQHNGGLPPLLALPGWMLTVGVWAGDLAAWLGWRPPIRSNAIQEMRRGVVGDPARWISQTGIKPYSAQAAVNLLPATIQEKWFARLYLLKAVALVTLVIFWCVSSLIALTLAFPAARNILLVHGVSFPVAHWVTLATSVMDFVIGCAIAWRRTSRMGLMVGIVVSAGYMAGAAILTPELWVEPLGALVKTGPAIILMLICLALSDDR